MIVFVLLFWRLQENPNEEKKRLSFGNPLRKLNPDLKLSPSSQATPTESKPPTEFVLFVWNRCWEMEVPQIEACVYGDRDKKEGSATK